MTKFKKLVSLITLATVLSVGVAHAQSDYDVERDQSTIGKMMTKLGRGVLNIVTCWLEIPRNVAIQWEQTDPITGLFVGGAKGIGWGFARLVTGAYETLSFPFPVPPGYVAMIEPEYIVQDVWGADIPGLTNSDSNDPRYPANAPIYPQNFNF